MIITTITYFCVIFVPCKSESLARGWILNLEKRRTFFRDLAKHADKGSVPRAASLAQTETPGGRLTREASASGLDVDVAKVAITPLTLLARNFTRGRSASSDVDASSISAEGGGGDTAVGTDGAAGSSNSGGRSTPPGSTRRAGDYFFYIPCDWILHTLNPIFNENYQVARSTERARFP
jgi:hypothetical protein